jgi:hypothetical protein
MPPHAGIETHILTRTAENFLRRYMALLFLVEAVDLLFKLLEISY